MKCRFCGEELKTGSDKCLWSRYGKLCKMNVTKMHVGITDGNNCIYCGETVRPAHSNKLWTCSGPSCRNSPTKMHCLQ